MLEMKKVCFGPYIGDFRALFVEELLEIMG